MPYPILRRTIFPILKKFYGSCEGLENIPASGPYIIAANHVGLIDYLFITLIFYKYSAAPIHFISKPNFVRDRFFRKAWGQLPIDPNNKESCLYEAWECLKESEIVAIFPESTATGNVPEFLPAKTGAAKLALWSRVPVIPVSYYGPARLGKYFLSIKNIRSLFSFYKKIEIKIGQPLSFYGYYQKEIDKTLLTEVTRKIMTSVAALSGKKYLH